MCQEEARGRLPARLVPDQDRVAEEVARRVLQVATTGEPEFTEPFVKLPGEPRAHAWAVDIFPLKDATGQTHAVAGRRPTTPSSTPRGSESLC
ncbi:PAS domain-containing protein [Streptomyces sp. NPDC006872]|uniref:PAS domain-containing protein n=1 Tax=Streptomyces sp. NPDC006872 TaxID=3155720 RepID=UPI0033EC3A14